MIIVLQKWHNMKFKYIFLSVLILASQNVFIQAMIKEDDQRLCVPYEKHVAKDCTLDSWCDFLNGKISIGQAKENIFKDEKLPKELAEKIYDYASAHILPIINNDLKTLLNNHPEYVKEKPHISLAIINNRLITHFGKYDRVSEKNKESLYTDKVWEYILTHNQPVKDLIDKACKRTALSKIEAYINQLPEPVKKYALNYAFYPQRWYACNREVCNLETSLFLTHHNTILNTAATHQDKVYAISRSQDSIIILNNKTLKQEGKIDLDTKIRQLAYDHTKNAFYVMSTNGTIYCYDQVQDDEPRIIAGSSEFLSSIMNIDPENQYLYLSSPEKVGQKTLRIDLKNLERKSFTHQDLIDKYHIDLMSKGKSNNIQNICGETSAAQLSSDGSQLIIETMDAHIRVYELHPDQKEKDKPIASLKDRMDFAIAPGAGSIATLKNGSFIYRHTNNYYNPNRRWDDQVTTLGTYKPTNKKITNRKAQGKIPLLPDGDYHYFNNYGNTKRLKQLIFFRASKDPNHAVLKDLKKSLKLDEAYIITTDDDNQINLIYPNSNKIVKIIPKFNIPETLCIYRLEQLIKKKYSENWGTRLFKTCFGSYLYNKYVLYKKLEATNNCPNKDFIFNTANNQYHWSESLGFTGKILGPIIHTFWKTIGMFDTEGNVAAERIAKD
jgi:hypothetical protein